MASRVGTITVRAGAALLFAGTLAMVAWTADAPAPAVAAVRAVPPAKPLAVKPMAVALPAPVPSPDAYVVKRVLDIPGPLRHGDFVWDEAGAPAGPIVVTVDLQAQTLSVFRGGHEIGVAVILYGADEKPTPLGVFQVTEKDADHVSNIYDAPMPYMLRLTNDGISIHGSEVEDGLMTHGCVGVPTKFARKLFAAVGLGDRVIVTRGEVLAVGGAITAA